MIHDSTQAAAQVTVAARRARAKAIGQCLVALCSGLLEALRTRPLFHEERCPPGRRR